MKTNLIIPIANEFAPGQGDPGVIALANESRFDAAHFSEPLTAYAVGFPDSENLQEILDILFAPVEVPRKFEYKAALESEAYVSETDDIRAIGDAGFKLLKYGGESNTSKTLNKGLTGVIDKDEMVAGDEEKMVARLINRLRRNDLRRGMAALDAAATNTAKTWNTSADPDMDVIDDLDTGNLARGYPGNRVIFGTTAWAKRQRAFRSSDKAGAFASAMMSMEALAGMLGVETVAVCRELYKTAKGKANTRFMAAYVYMLYNSPVADREDPSNAKRFFTPTESGQFRVYKQELVKTIEISVEHYSRLVVTNTTGIRKFTVS